MGVGMRATVRVMEGRIMIVDLSRSTALLDLGASVEVERAGGAVVIAWGVVVVVKEFSAVADCVENA